MGGAIAALLTLAVLSARPRTATLAEIPAAPADVSVSTPGASETVRRAAFFDDQVAPQIRQTDAANRQAAERCLRRIGQQIDRYREGIDPFVEDLTSLSTRWGIVRRLPGKWWHDDDRVRTFVREKFESHLFSEARLAEDLAGVMNDFKQEVDANQKQMLVSVQASLGTSDLPEVRIDSYDTFVTDVADRLVAYSQDQGMSSLYSALSVLIASEVGSYAAVSVVSTLLSRFGSVAAATAAAGMGATAGAGAVGAGGGSLAGPVGTVVGLGIGLVVGLAIDWWLTEQFEEKLAAQLQDYLTRLQHTLLHGNDPVDDAKPRPPDDRPLAMPTRPDPGNGGLATTLPLVCDQLRNAYRERFYQQIVTRESMP